MKCILVDFFRIILVKPKYNILIHCNFAAAKTMNSMLKNIISQLQSYWTKFKAWRVQRRARFRTLPWYRKAANLVLTAVVLFLVYLFLVDINFLWLFGKSPSMSSIKDPNQSVASQIISADGKVIGKYFHENRMPVEFNEISPMLINALICTEDERFYNHHGVDFKGIFAAVKDAMQGRKRGASTITQQLVKNMFKTRKQYSTGLFGYVPGVKLLIMKTKEWTTAVKIEMFYAKDDILTMYLNTVDFGSNSYGIKTASKTFFKTTPSKLTTEQSATLVGLLKATTSYSPILHPKRSKERRNVVLQNLLEHKIITAEECDSLKALPIKLNYSIEQAYDGDALHFRSYLAKDLEGWLKQNGYDLYSDGLKIHVTIDTRLQKYAEYAVDKQMRRLQKRFNEHWRGQNPWQDENHQEIPNFIEGIAKRTEYYRALKDRFDGDKDSIDAYLNRPHKMKVFDYDKGEVEMEMSVMDSIRYMNHFMHTGFVAMEPESGYVRAWVGDVNFKYWQYDNVGQSKRQPGSTFKLFVYTAAMMHGMSPCDMMTDKAVSWPYEENHEQKIWSPHNADGRFGGYPITLKHAFARSINSIAVQLAQQVGIKEVVKYAHLMGIKTPLEEIPALSLGASDVSLLELVNSYCTVVNEGMYHDPVLVTTIEDRDGKVIYTNQPVQRRAIPYEASWLMLELLKGGLTEPGGTTQALWEWDLFRWNTDFGGKTGTSSNHSDAWFVGVTPKLVGGSWVGGEHRCVHFRTGSLGEGSKSALPEFALFMEKVLADPALTKYRAKFPTQPKEKITRNYSCHTYMQRSAASDTLESSEGEEPMPDAEVPVEETPAEPTE